MIATATALPEVFILEPQVHGDARGWFMESHSDASFSAAIGRPMPFVQDNHSKSARGVVRGLHYQLPPFEQGKLVRVVHGRSFHAAVDIRRSSPHFGRAVTVELDAVTKRQLWVPVGFAHGFLALEDGTEVVYKVTAPWSCSAERGIRWDDPSIGIVWPTTTLPLLSTKDASAPPLAAAELP
jgi:dTDP-4-dehydrorhamnose 3,5-epimerase